LIIENGKLKITTLPPFLIISEGNSTIFNFQLSIRFPPALISMQRSTMSEDHE